MDSNEKVEKVEYRAVIKFLVLEGQMPTEIHSRLKKVYGKNSPSQSTVKKWALQFKRGRVSLQDDPREGRPRCATANDIVEKVEKVIQEDRRLKVREVADAAGISSGSAFEILTKNLQLKKIFSRWVPCYLSDEQKTERVAAAEACLGIFRKNNINDFIRHCITVGETWIPIYDVHKSVEVECSPPKMKRIATLTGKLKALIFWDCEGVLFIEYVEKGKEVTAEFFCQLLERLNERMQEKRPGLQHNNPIFFHLDITPIEDDDLIHDKLKELKYVSLEQPENSPDLSPSDSSLFQKLENHLQAKRFTSKEEATTAISRYFHELPVSNFRDGIELLSDRWTKCIANLGNYIDLNSTNRSAPLTEVDYVTE